MRPVFLDTETAGALKLRDVGGRQYARHSSTLLLCLCASWDLPNGQPRSITWVPDSLPVKTPRFDDTQVEIHRGVTPPTELLDAINHLGVTAHNATTFDRHVWNRFVPGHEVEWIDTIDMARSNGLPAGLDKLGEWFLGEGKDEGHMVLKKMMNLTWDERELRWWNRFIQPGSLLTVIRYCLRDVDILRLIYDRVSATDAHDTGGVEIHRKINDYGVGFDEELAAKIAAVSTQLIVQSGRRIEELTKGELLATSLRSIPKVRKWLESHGVSLKNLRRETVEAFINNPDAYLLGTHDDTDEYEPETEEIGVTPEVLEVLRLRNSALRVTGAKLERASAACIGGRLYDLFGYWQAHTGRWSSRLMQVHNLPSPKGPLENVNLPHLCSNCTLEAINEEAKRLGVLPDDILSSMVRPTLVPTRGKVFVIVDYSAIENRVLGWCARSNRILDVFRRGLDPYIDMATDLYGIPYAEVTKFQRTCAKPVVLGGGYGLGHKRLGDYAAAMKIDLSKSGLTTEQIIEKFRTAFPEVAGYIDGDYEGRPVRRGGIWRDVESAFRDVTSEDVSVAEAGRCRFTREGNTTVITLPSGRRLSYRKARFEPYVDQWDRHRLALVYTSGRGIVRTYGGKLVENIVQAIARDILRDGMIDVWGAGFPIPLDVHDEIVAETDEADGERTLETIEHIMSVAPTWAEGLPLSADGHVSPRYTKTKWVA